MSAQARGTTLRLIAPQNSSAKIVSSLGPRTKLESTNIVLTAGQLSTEDMVRNIRELTRLRDELSHTLRQLGIPRAPRKNLLESPNFDQIVSEGQKELEVNRRRFQETQSRIETIERQIEETRKQSARISELIQAGFSSGEALSRQGEFTKILGRLPSRKLEVAQRALQSNLKDQVILATGNRTKDMVYILVATPPDKASQALQTLILHDFVQTDTPTSNEPDLNKTSVALEEKRETLSRELGTSREELKVFRNEAGEMLNRLADQVQDSLLFLRAVLKMGEGTNAAHAFAWLEKPPQAKLVTALSTQGILVETE